jgi:(p)ppGpp synthase/HD superfamily hydrolase
MERKSMDTREQDRLIEAFELAVRLHADQTRKGSGAPYISHLMGVAAIALEYGADTDQACAALLHDAVEDQGGAPTLERIREAFGERVARIVAGCTDTDQTPKPPWRERKEAYIVHLAHADDSTLLVSAADKLYNLRAILTDYLAHGEDVWSRFKGGRDGSLWYYRALVEAFQKRGCHALLITELERTLRELEKVLEGSGG